MGDAARAAAAEHQSNLTFLHKTNPPNNPKKIHASCRTAGHGLLATKHPVHRHVVRLGGQFANQLMRITHAEPKGPYTGLGEITVVEPLAASQPDTGRGEGYAGNDDKVYVAGRANRSSGYGLGDTESPAAQRFGHIIVELHGLALDPGHDNALLPAPSGERRRSVGLVAKGAEQPHAPGRSELGQSSYARKNPFRCHPALLPGQSPVEPLHFGTQLLLIHKTLRLKTISPVPPLLFRKQYVYLWQFVRHGPSLRKPTATRTLQI